MKDAYKILQKVDALLLKERGTRSDKMDSFICFGGNTDGCASIIHGQPGMLQAIFVEEMQKEEAVAQIILQAAATYQVIQEKLKKKGKIVS